MKVSLRKIISFLSFAFACCCLFSIGTFAAGKTRVIQTNDFSAFSEATADLNRKNGASGSQGTQEMDLSLIHI